MPFPSVWKLSSPTRDQIVVGFADGGSSPRTQEDILTASSGRFSSEFDKAFGTSMKAGTDVYRQRYAKLG